MRSIGQHNRTVKYALEVTIAFLLLPSTSVLSCVSFLFCWFPSTTVVDKCEYIIIIQGMANEISCAFL